jgi:hypothetical protein
MKYKKIKLSLILLLAIGLTELKAQEAIPASGGNATGAGGSVSYSVGQVVYAINTGTGGSAVAGVQQPYEISVVTGLPYNNNINLICSAYPNPTIAFLKLRIEGDVPTEYTASLYTSNGVLLKNVSIEANETTIDMSNLVISIYFLKIVHTINTSSSQEVKTFKIIKN